MDIDKVIEAAWDATISDFENANMSGDSWLWTEATLRLDFLRRLSETVKLKRILAETSYHIGQNEYKPDIVVDISDDENTKTVVFEMKFFSQTEKWREDLEKLKRYVMIGWNQGYFLAIGSDHQCNAIKKDSLEIEEHPQYVIKILVYPSRIASWPHYKFAESVLKKSLGKDVQYIVNEYFGAVAFFENYQAFL